jgi:hypothetical protein
MIVVFHPHLGAPLLLLADRTSERTLTIPLSRDVR